MGVQQQQNPKTTTSLSSPSHRSFVAFPSHSSYRMKEWNGGLYEKQKTVHCGYLHKE